MFSIHTRPGEGSPTLRLGERTLVYDPETAGAYLLVDDDAVLRW